MAIDKLVDSAQLDANLTVVANAIRSKAGVSGALSFPAGMVATINAIPTGGNAPNLQSKSVTYTSNGTDTVTPSAGYDGLSQVNVTVNVSGGGAMLVDLYVGTDYDEESGIPSDYNVRFIDSEGDYYSLNYDDTFSGQIPINSLIVVMARGDMAVDTYGATLLEQVTMMTEISSGVRMLYYKVTENATIFTYIETE